MRPGREGLVYRSGLDGVRAIAVAVVVLYHGQVNAFSGGFLGVDVFFVLSGFLITSLLVHEHQISGRIDLGRFWMGRVRRLVPASLLVVAVSLLVVAVFSSEDLRLLRGDALASVLQFNNWHQIFAERSYFETFGRPSLLQHYWSLAVEEQFYLVWPLLLYFGLGRFGRSGMAIFAAGGALASVVLMAVLFDPSHDPTRIYFGTDTRATPILVGVVLAFVWPVMGQVARPSTAARLTINLGGVAGLLLVSAAVLGWSDYDPFVYRGGLLVAALGAALLIASAAHPYSTVGRGLGVAPLVWLGARSYGIYLWHWPVMAMSRPERDTGMDLWLLVPVQVVVTLVLATLSYRYVEMPIRRGEMQARVRSWLARTEPPRRFAVMVGTPALVALLIGALAVWPSVTRRLPGGRSASALANAKPVLPAAVTSRTTASPAVAGTAPRGPILAVGASVMLEAIHALEAKLHAHVDAEDSRQPGVILQRLKDYRDAGSLPPVVVVQTGENSPVSDADLKGLKKVLRGVPRVVIMNLRYPGESWIDDTNEQLERLVADWPQATIADWRSASDNPDLLWDGTHPNEKGDDVYAATVAEALSK